MNDELQVFAPKKIGKYNFQGTIGEGAFSVVKLVQHSESREYFACKVVPKSRIQTTHLHARFEAEIRINQQLHHPGIVEMYDLLSDDLNYYIIMEFCPNGELFQYIIDKQHLSESEAQPIFRQILETLEYIHSMGISHRDMKPENLLIDKVGHIKISDFGLSRFLDTNGLVDTPCGSPCYASPECISGKSYDGITTDVWSSGVILYAMLTGQLPWTKRNQTQLFQQIKRGEFSIPSFLSPECTDFIQKLMTVDCKKRITIPQAYEHPWLRKTQPILPNMPYPSSRVSLRMVDVFFGYLVSMIDLPRSALERNTSTRSLNFKKALRLLKFDQKSNSENNEINVNVETTKIRKRKRKIEPSHPQKGQIENDEQNHHQGQAQAQAQAQAQNSQKQMQQMQSTDPTYTPTSSRIRKVSRKAQQPTQSSHPVQHQRKASSSMKTVQAANGINQVKSHMSIPPSQVPQPKVNVVSTSMRPKTGSKTRSHSRAVVTKPHPPKPVL